jgi:ABC-type dipeptide/oligopeptide/nickel transport system permease subunit
MTPAVAKADTHPTDRIGLWRDAWTRFRRNRAALVSAIVVLAIIIASLIGPWLVYLYNGFEYDTLGLENRLANPSIKHLLGTDTLGRDLLARVLYGSRISLMVGFVSTLISLVIGIAYGATAGYFGILVRHILPNTIGPIIVYATLTIPSVILGEAFLSFLGLGVPPPASSLGVLAEEGAEAISVHPVLLVAPGTLMALMLMSLNFLGDGLRDALDPRMRRVS